MGGELCTHVATSTSFGTRLSRFGGSVSWRKCAFRLNVTDHTLTHTLYNWCRSYVKCSLAPSLAKLGWKTFYGVAGHDYISNLMMKIQQWKFASPLRRDIRRCILLASCPTSLQVGPTDDASFANLVTCLDTLARAANPGCLTYDADGLKQDGLYSNLQQHEFLYLCSLCLNRRKSPQGCLWWVGHIRLIQAILRIHW